MYGPRNVSHVPSLCADLADGAGVIALTAGRVTYTRGDRGDLRTGRQDSGTFASLLGAVGGDDGEEAARGAERGPRRTQGGR